MNREYQTGRVYCKGIHVMQLLAQQLVDGVMVNMFLELLYQKTFGVTASRNPWRYLSTSAVGSLKTNYICKNKCQMDLYCREFFPSSKELKEVQKFFIPIRSRNHWRLLEVDFYNHNIQSYDSMCGQIVHVVDIKNIVRWFAFFAQRLGIEGISG